MYKDFVYGKTEDLKYDVDRYNKGNLWRVYLGVPHGQCM
tara:strand:- start:191 stop:307 length:117 start_codon:yes stop_codon:yes gene_type:complete